MAGKVEAGFPQFFASKIRIATDDKIHG